MKASPGHVWRHIDDVVGVAGHGVRTGCQGFAGHGAAGGDHAGYLVHLAAQWGGTHHAQGTRAIIHCFNLVGADGADGVPVEGYS